MNIAIVRLSALGDIIFSMAVLQFIKRARPDTKVYWVVESCYKELLEDSPDIEGIIEVDLKSLKKNLFLRALLSQITSLKNYSFIDIAIDMQGLLKSAIVARLVARKRAGFDKNGAREKAAAWLYESKVAVPYEENVVIRATSVVGHTLGFEVTQSDIMAKKPFLYFTEEQKQRVEQFFEEGKKTALIVCGASKEPKIYPLQYYAELAIMLAESGEVNILLSHGSDFEHKVARFVASKCAIATVLPHLSLGYMKAVIAGCDIVVGGDTGIVHMAWAMNRPSITIFGNTPAERNTFSTQINRVISSGSLVDAKKLNRDDDSIKTIPVTEIYAVAKELLRLQ